MTTMQACEALTTNHVHWDRKDTNHIVVWTSGYKTANHTSIETFLMQAGMRMVSEDYDTVCGKTRAIYKHK